MSALREAMSHAVLGWVKPELDDTLRQVREEIEAFGEDPADVGRMRFCVGYLHQVQGTLRMVELYAPAMVAEELEQLAQALQVGKTIDRDEACAVLMRGAVLLPDYLERLQDGHRDIPIVLLPLLNEIRAARGAPGLSESMLFPPGTHDDAPTPSEAEIDHARGSISGRNRELLDTVGNAVKEELLRVKDALDLHLRTNDQAAALQTQVTELGNVADTLGMMGLGVARDVVQQQRDALRAVVEGSRPADESTLLDIAGALLYVDASLDDQVARLGHPAGTGGEEGTGADSQRTVEILAQEAINNFAAARERFVAFIETNWDHTQLDEVPRLLEEVAGAMRILELSQAADYLIGVRQYVGTELLGKRRVPGGQQLDTLADAMASLEYYLEALRERRPNREEILEITRTSLENLRYWPLPDDSVADAAAGEAATVADAGSAPAPAAPVAEASPAPVAPFEPPPENRAVEPPPADAPATVAEPTISFDPVSFEETDAAATETVFAPLVFETDPAPAAEAIPAAEDAFAFTVPQPTPQAPPPGLAATAPTSVEQVVAPAAAIAPSLGGFDSGAGDIDDEIREVFLEEFDEEIINLGRLLPAWRAVPNDMERLRPIRRVFHTLKGSGRLVGAKVLGEFSWKIENMLNRVLDHTRAPSDAVLSLLEQSCEALPQLNAALRGQGEIRADVEGLKAVADRIAAGEDAYYSAETKAAPAAEPAPAAVAVAPVEAAVPAAAFEPEAEGTPASVDAVLREILEAEVDNHLDTVDAWLMQAQVLPQAATDPLLRAFHTMNGALAMADVPEITDVTAAAEQYVKRLLASGQMPSGEGIAALADTAQAIRRSIAALQAPSPRIPVFSALTGRLGALRDSLPEVKPSAQVVDDTAQNTYAETFPVIDPPIQIPDTELSAHDLSVFFGGGGVGEEAPDLTHAVGAAADSDESAFAEVPQNAEASAPAASAASGKVGGQAAPPAAESGITFYDVAYTISPRTRAEDTDSAAPAAAAPADDADEADADAGLTVEEITLESLEQDIAEPVAPATGQSAQEFDEDRSVSIDTEAFGIAASDIVTADVVETAPEADEWQAAGIAAEAEEPSPQADAEEAVAAGSDSSAVDTAAETVGVVENIEAPEPQASTIAHAEDSEAETPNYDVAPETVAEPEAVDAAPAVETELPAPTAGETPVEALEAVDAAADQLETGVAGDEAQPSVDQPDDALDPTGLDLDLVDIFVEEGNDLLDHSDGLLAKLRETPDDRTPVTGLQRDLHTLKGGARMAGIHAIGDLGHAIESMLESIVAQRTELDNAGIHLLERGFDHLHGLVKRVGNHRSVGIPEQLIAEFNAHARGLQAPAAQEPAAAAALAPAVELAPLSAPVETEFVQPEEEFFPSSQQQEQVRVRADLLDRLVNHAGEVAIYRARLEQQLGAFRGAMGELDRTNIRLHDQLRRLDLETEAQIVARYQREGDKQDPTFDPLELDRFSTLQQLSRALAESAADLSGLQGVLDDLARQYDSLLHQQSRVSSELQDGLMRARMVPFEGIVPRLRRVLRQAAADTGKHVRLQLDGTHGELDRNVLERMTAPLEHLLRNSVAHGLEAPEARRKAGKPEEGSVRVTLRREGSEMVLRVSDDGAGLNREAIRRRAEERGLLQPGVKLADVDLDRMILEPGFSTYDSVSQLAGRGVGMDVVYNEVRQLGGSLDIDSQPNQGATFTLRLPQTLAVTQAVFVQIGETQFAVPVAAVSGIGRISRERFEAEGGAYHYGGEDYALHNLGTLVGHAPARAEGQPQVPLLLVRAGDLRVAVAVDAVLGNREIVVKAVGPQIASIPGIYGATITGDGSIVVILDVAPLVRRHLAQPQQPAAHAPVQEQRRVPLVMVVDDSLTMRKVTGRVLERHNFEVTAARDGVEALEKLEERVPDLMLLDIEMPRMDGYELATAMKADARFKDVPIVMITSRTGDKHRQRAFDIGVQRYLGKPYQELDLMRNVYDLLGIARVRE
ncbi:chemosensory pili system protein ChpA (sensor histidine kinase/response regulator) [Pseudoxanthomonas wuyuanensis]|uniref:Chemotaxis protein CheA n=1 Tax=Pseudoxanthomonas wuyuanensis TaxID=1073196 RepID=A0A286D7V4_9GAMM|nr:Hpt domain-containing protein [Pseudoxanthomonas wuyuanensis]KAF1720356.1 chemotaxis protein [Pseudoxanthomonas wuyuanensis]SOD54719.1 chemosensory pili system protein ChpA (sensor histidine kinase/response regulator) [Pseudoxanthomonas wuyuanensis]